jgi:NADPH-dependent 2,4-dienoyl-CoA reductase/sulfur reductase-like enzyme
MDFRYNLGPEKLSNQYGEILCAQHCRQFRPKPEKCDPEILKIAIKMNKKKPKIAIVGAGLTGLTTAFYLKKPGLMCIFSKNPTALEV